VFIGVHLRPLESQNVSGLIFDIQGFSVHDGPGCRTLVFLSGCPLRCSWCSNPEGQLLRPRLMYRAPQCVPTCQRCVSACPHGAITVRSDDFSRPGRQATEVATTNNPPLTFDRALCNYCESFDCVQACLHEALRIAGRTYTVDELLRILSRDQGYWGSQGGVTFSGGEPLFQAEFLLAVLAKCRAAYMHTAVETCAHVDTALLLEVLKWTDWLFVDIKHMDSAAHRAGTGVGNELILQNIEAVAAAGWGGRLIVRVPIVPGFNDSAENLQATAAFVQRLHRPEVNLLPFHRLGNSKYEQLGLAYKYAPVASPTPETMLAAQRLFAAVGLPCYVDSATPF